MYKLCVFDMDGTFINSIGDIAAAMNRSLKKLGHETYEEEEYCHMVGNGMDILCERALKDGSREEIDKLISLYKEDYLKNCYVRTAPYEYMEQLINNLREKGIKCCILSNKPHGQLLEVIDNLKITNLFDMVLGQTDRFPIKPAPDSLLYIIDKFGVSKDEVAYIGDSNVDIRLGKSAGVYTIGALWGFRKKEELISEGADALAEDAYHLEKLLIVKKN